MTATPIKVLIVDDHQLIIDGLKGFVATDASYKIVGEANNGNDAIKLASVLQPDIILMDIEMPGLSGIQASQEIKKERADCKIIIISMHKEKELIKKLISYGIDGYLLKNSSQLEVLSAMKKVLEGESYFSQDVNESLATKNSEIEDGKSEMAIFANLTEREIEILKLVALGKTNKEMGEALFISHRTVDTHRTNLMKKLEINNVAGLIRYAFKNGLIQ
ncbi:MAG: response regulator transcription factor [Crocinitomicaceae bacterium]